MATPPISFYAPKGSRVFNFLYSDMEVEDLGENMAHVVLPNGRVIDAGWYPHADPGGHYVIRVTQDGRELETVDRYDDVLDTPLVDAYDVADRISQLADQYGSDEPWTLVSCEDDACYNLPDYNPPGTVTV